MQSIPPIADVPQYRCVWGALHSQLNSASQLEFWKTK
jgi:hypothetical protein